MDDRDLESAENIERLYDTALKPDRVHDLLNLWEEKLRTRAGSEDDDPASSGFDQHLDLAIQVADMSYAKWESDTTRDDYDIHSDTRPAAILSHQARVLDVNSAAAGEYKLHVGDQLDDLPFEPHTIRSIGEQLRQQSGSSVLRTTRTDTQATIAVYLLTTERGQTILRTTDLVWSQGLEGVLREAFGLTTAELAVTRLIAEGHVANDVAAMRGAAIATVRAQIRSIFAKTNSDGLNDLVRMVIGLSALPEFRLAEDEQALSSTQQVRPAIDDRHMFDLPDGRQIEYAEFGAENGLPVLYVHDNFFNIVWPDRLVRLFEARGMRVIAPLRPLFGESSAPHSGYGSVEACAEDLQTMTDELFDRPFVVFTRTIGLPYATALANRIPDRVLHLVAFAPALPYADEDDIHGMPSAHKFAALANLRMPKMLDFVARVVFAYFRQRGALPFYRWAYRDVPADLAVLEQDTVQRCVEATTEFAVSNGASAWLQDMQRISDARRFNSWDCTVPVSCYIGSADSNTRWERAERLVQSGADISLHRVEGAGELFFYTHLEMAAEAVASKLTTLE